MNRVSPLRILIADDHAVVRNGLAAFVMAYDEFCLVGEARTGEQAVELAAAARPDVILMDLVMPGIGGVEATRAIRQRDPRIQVIALTSFKDSDLVHGALEAGAIGYLMKEVTAEELAQAICQAAVGRPTLSAEARQVLRQEQHNPGAEDGCPPDRPRG